MTLNVVDMKEKAGAWTREARANPLFRYGVLGAAAVLISDQASKFWIVNIIDLPARRRIAATATASTPRTNAIR